MMTAFNIFGSFMRLKRQCISPLQKDYLEFCDALRICLDEQKPCDKKADLQTIDPLNLPLDILRQQVLERISGNGKSQALTILLQEAYDMLNLSLEQRNIWLKENRHRPLNQAANPQDSDSFIKEYCGLELHNGMLDVMYPNLIKAISQEIDDCIWFSKKLCEELQTYGDKLLTKNGNNKGALRINSIEFSSGKNEIPDDSEY